MSTETPALPPLGPEPRVAGSLVGSHVRQGATMSKPSIRKQAGCWVVVRPGYGFSPASVAVFDSWKAAVGSLRSAPASAGATAERGNYTLALPYGRTARGTIRLEDTAWTRG